MRPERGAQVNAWSRSSVTRSAAWSAQRTRHALSMGRDPCGNIETTVSMWRVSQSFTLRRCEGVLHLQTEAKSLAQEQVTYL
jgi:hypothetical protein